MNDFFTSFFGSTGAGTSVVNTGGQIGLGLVNNKTKEIEGNYAVKLKELGNDETLTTQQFEVELAKLNAQRDAALAEVSSGKFNNTLILVGILAVIGAVVAVILYKKRK